MENMTTDDYKVDGNESGKIASLIIYTLVFVLGVLGNGVVIWVTGFKMKKTISAFWYLNLATADFLFAAFLPLVITERALDGHWPFGKFMCKLYHSILYMNMFASVYFLTVIGVDRCACVVWPVLAKNHRSVRKASCVTIGVWVLALALSSPYLVFMDTEDSQDTIYCVRNYALTNNFSNSTPAEIQLGNFRSGAMVFTRLIMGFVVPFTIIVSCYSVIIYRLRRNHSRAIRSGRPFKIIAAVVTAFFLCWAPFHVMQQIQLVGNQSETVLSIGFDIAICLAFLNSCLNPLLYVFMSQDFKDVFRRSILKVLENAFTEELLQTNTSTNPGIIGPSKVNTFSEAQL